MASAAPPTRLPRSWTGAPSRQPHTQGHGPAVTKDPWPIFWPATGHLVTDPPRHNRRKTTRKQGKDMSLSTCRERSLAELPCHVGDPDLWFADNPGGLERAKELCADCPIRRQCLDAALEREEPWGVWGGQIFERGAVVARKRPRGRPRKNPQTSPAAA